MKQVKKIRKIPRPVRGVRYSDAEWRSVGEAAFKAGLPVAEYIRAQTIPPQPPAPPTAACTHVPVLLVPGRLIGGLELCQCEICGRVGAAEAGEPVSWAQ